MFFESWYIGKKKQQKLKMNLYLAAKEINLSQARSSHDITDTPFFIPVNPVLVQIKSFENPDSNVSNAKLFVLPKF